MGTVDAHGVLMDQVYRYQRHFYDVTRKYYLFGRDRLIRELKLKEHARVIEIGCGTARNLIRIAKRYPGARLYGLDASAAMLETAQRAIRRAGLSDRIRLAHGYAETLSPDLFGESALFDDAIFSYSLSMIPDWRAAIAAAQGALAENGRLHIVDFGDLKGLGRIAERGLRAWLALFHVAPREELLRALESSTGAPGRLTMLPGRYAFLLTSCRSASPLTSTLLQSRHSPA